MAGYRPWGRRESDTLSKHTAHNQTLDTLKEPHSSRQDHRRTPASPGKGKARTRGLVLSGNGRQGRVAVKERLSNMELTGPEWQSEKGCGRGTNPIFAVHLLCGLGEGKGTPLQYSCLENPMDGGAWWAAVHGVAKSDMTEQLHFHFSLSCIGEGNGNPL